MSTIKSVYLQHLNGTTPNATMDTNGNFTVGGTVSGASSNMFRNRIINGDMRIDQRNAGASISSGWVVDRFTVDVSQSSKLTTQQNAGSVTPPVGFKNYLGITSSSSYSVGSTDYFLASQRIEGYNFADLMWGTANAKTVTLSFWVRSSLTGTFGGSFRNADDSRSYVFSYTVNSSNTWEYKTITLTGDTSGTWNTTNGRGVNISFGVGIGSTYSGTAGSWSSSNYLSVTSATSVVGTNGATWYITGVQLEAGTAATPFEVRPFGLEFDLCKRYYQTFGGNSSNERLGSCFNYGTAQARCPVLLAPVMRATPTLTVSAGSDWSVESSSTVACTSVAFDQASPRVAALNFSVASGLTSGQGGQIMANATTNARVNFSAEL